MARIADRRRDRKPLELRLSEPAALTIAPGSVSFGPARFEARGTQFSTVEVQQRDGRWRTSGTFDGLRPQALYARSKRCAPSGANGRRHRDR